ncbi:hypothetical protein CYMTET_24914 [Cymbomonas tetramitiformis]|uniref:F5/8 type C domain-containing protein n=1 Tax=Cymbomonas tetramitiformis TaxID=36881 RepID=A0AAE0KZF2_9CHLO|nr:hypothetical protein CYMTET_24914 [Cymbomonas tetramitiformis]
MNVNGLLALPLKVSRPRKHRAQLDSDRLMLTLGPRIPLQRIGVGVEREAASPLKRKNAPWPRVLLLIVPALFALPGIAVMAKLLFWTSSTSMTSAAPAPAELALGLVHTSAALGVRSVGETSRHPGLGSPAVGPQALTGFVQRGGAQLRGEEAAVLSPPMPSRSPPATGSLVELATGCPVTSDVRGNLGPASVVTSAAHGDWLKDRWQGAKDMSGTPIPGEHWLTIDLGRPCAIAQVEVDFEVAYAASYDVELADNGMDGPWRLLRSVEASVLSPAELWGAQLEVAKPRLH